MAKAYQPVTGIRVHAWGHYVGALAPWPGHQGLYVFQYAPEWLRQGVELAPLHMPLRSPPFSFAQLPRDTFRGLPALIADTLPDAFGNALIDGYLAAKGVPKAAITPLDRLACLGDRAMGALQFKPSREPQRSHPTALELNELVMAARSALRGRFDGDRETHAAIAQLIQVGTSAGGQRAKAVVAWNPDTREIRSGQVDAGNGFSQWLLKLDTVKPAAKGDAEEPIGKGVPYGRIEYAYYLMAREAGITMAECCLLEEEERAHFLTRRFDRDGDTRHHIQTLCAMAHLDYMQKATHDYAQLFETLEQLELGKSTRAEVFRRMVFNVAARNCDDHTKNHGFLLREGGRWELAPAYDITHSYSPDSPWVSQHLMSVNGKFSQITLTDVLAVGQRWNVPDMKGIVDRVNAAVANWDVHANAAGIPADVIKQIGADHRPFCKGGQPAGGLHG
ncbi:MAG TPA: type II toxin-antitoxin system HipA family toxin [Oleiagrimonas sp.]|nr:type II toxin-antitoxin system HipA family toxin [Oleiagrimonas sp.]